MKITQISIIVLSIFIYCSSVYSEDKSERYLLPNTPAKFIEIFKSIDKSEKNYILQKQFLIHYAVKAEITSGKEVKTAIRIFLNTILGNSEFDKKKTWGQSDYQPNINYAL